MKIILSIFLFLISQVSFAQVTCTVTGPAGYSGPITSDIKVYCGTTIPPVIKPPTSACTASQISTPINRITFQRQCTGQVLFLPTSRTYGVGPLTDLSTVIGGTWPSYANSGTSPTFSIQSGYYVSLAFTPTATGAIQFVANPSYGDSGTISLSTSPGGLTRGATGVVCALAYGASNSMYISTTAQVCPVTAGQTYYVNFADTDINGTFLCYGGSPGSCASSYVSYTLYTSN